MLKKVRGEGYEPNLSTDRSQHYLLKGHRRWRGNFENYISILRAGCVSAADWVIVMQDDVSVPSGLFNRIRYVLSFADCEIVSFYVPTNQTYFDAVAEKKHVVTSCQNMWIQCLAYRRAALPHIYQWGMDHVQEAWNRTGDGGSDDDFVALYASVMQRPVRTIVPSFVQHLVGPLSPSLMKTADKGARYPRTSSCYEPTFDPTTVNWAAEFANPKRDSGKITRSDPRYKRTWGLS